MWFAAGVRFECQRCGRCCGGDPGYVWVTPDDVDAICARLKMPREEFVKRYVRRLRARLSLKERENGDCVLLDGTCVAYEQRPAQCRNFPFWPDAMESEAAFIEMSRGCPGIGKGRTYGLEEILALMRGRRDT